MLFVAALLISNCIVLTVEADCRSAPVDVVFLLDSSDSLGNDNFTALKQFIKDITNAFLIGPNNVQISVVSFSSKVRNEFNLKTYHTNSQLLDAIDRISYIQENKHTALAIQHVRTHSFEASAGDRPNAPNILILLTDEHSSDTSKTLAEARRIHNKNVTVIVVGVGTDRSDQELNRIASTSGDVLAVQSFDSLPTFTGRLQQLFCTVDGGWSQFGPYSACTKTCGGGGQFRIRYCSNPRPLGGGRPCPGPTVEFRQCNNKKCPGHTFIRRSILDNKVDGAWTEYGNFSVCTTSCGGGWMTRRRTCTNPSPTGGGRCCVGREYDVQTCNTQPCPNTTTISIRSTETTTAKSLSMDTSFVNHIVSISTIPIIAHSMDTTPKASTIPADKTVFGAKLSGGTDVRGTSTTPMSSKNEETAGITHIGMTASGTSLPVDGAWTEYGNFSVCTTSCGGGWMTRGRTCTNPSPTGGGRYCVGRAHDVQPCNTQPCSNTTTIVITSTDTTIEQSQSMDTSFVGDSASTTMIPSVASAMGYTAKASTRPADSTLLGAKVSDSTHAIGTSKSPPASRRAETTEGTAIGDTASGATLTGTASIGTYTISTTPMPAASAGITSIGETASVALLQSSAHGIGTLATPTISRGVESQGITHIGKTASGATFAGSTRVIGTFTKFTISSAASSEVASIAMTASGASSQSNAHVISTPIATMTSRNAPTAAVITLAGILNPDVSSPNNPHVIGDLTAPTTSSGVAPAGISSTDVTASGNKVSVISPSTTPMTSYGAVSSETSPTGNTTPTKSRGASSSGKSLTGVTASRNKGPVIGTVTTSTTSRGAASSGMSPTGVNAPEKKARADSTLPTPTTSRGAASSGISPTGVNATDNKARVDSTLTTPTTSRGATSSGILPNGVTASGNNAHVGSTLTTPTTSRGAKSSGISPTGVNAPDNKARVDSTLTTPTTSRDTASSRISPTGVTASGNNANVGGTLTALTTSRGAASSGISPTGVTGIGNNANVGGTLTTPTISRGAASSGILHADLTASGNNAHVGSILTTPTTSRGAASSGILPTGVTASGNNANVGGTLTTPTTSRGAASSGILPTGVTASENNANVSSTLTTPTTSRGAKSSGISPTGVTASGNNANVGGTLTAPTTSRGAASSGILPTGVTASGNNANVGGTLTTPTISRGAASSGISHTGLTAPGNNANVGSTLTTPTTSRGAASSGISPTGVIASESKSIGASITTSDHSSKTPHRATHNENELSTFPEATHTDADNKLNSETFAIIGLVTASILVLLFLIVIIVRKIKRKWDKEHKNRQKANNKVTPLMMEDIEVVNMLRYSNFHSTHMFKGKAMPAVERGALDF